MKRETWFIALVVVVALGAGAGWAVSSVATPEPVTAPIRESVVKDTTEQAKETTSDSAATIVWQVSGDTYTTNLEYDTPAGIETNQLSLTITDGAVTEYDFTQGTPDSAKYHQRFADQLDQVLVGTPISELADLDAVAGATLTSNAFAEAISNLPQ